MANVPPGSPPKEATINDVARAAGVSIRTVSRVLNRSPLVNQATRSRIDEAIARLGFFPSARARGLATGRSYLIGVVHNDRNALVLDALLRGIVKQASDRGYELVVHPSPTGDDGSIADVVDFVRRSRVDGLIVIPPVSGIAGMPAALALLGVPAVALSSVWIKGYASVIVSDERRGAGDAARHLIELGHTRIAILNGPTGVHSAAERRAGFVDALQAAGLDLAGEDEGDYHFDSGLSAATRLLGREPRPTAIFAANDIMGAAVLKAAATRKIAVPDMLSVVGFDGSIIAKMLSPALTTVRRPLDELAQGATAQLLDAIEGESFSNRIQVGLDLVPGDSSARLSG